MKNRRRKKYGDKDGNPLSINDIMEFVTNITEEELEELVSRGLLRKKNDKYEFVNSKNSSGIGGVYRMYMPYSKVFSTLTATGSRDVVVTDYINPNLSPDEYKKEFITDVILNKKYRPLTVAETQRIQGFPGKFIPHQDERIAKKHFGNAVSPPVIKALVNSILDTGVFNTEAFEYATPFANKHVVSQMSFDCISSSFPSMTDGITTQI
jgi:DNA (cytosine-5)-methyltransferase 1